MTTRMLGSRKLIVLLALGLLAAGPAHAIPVLQIYIEGAMYDQDMETWVTSSGDFRLWVIGDVSKFGTIYDVQLTAAHLTGETGTITLTPTTTSLLTDPSTPSSPSPVAGVGGDGTVPIMSSGASLATHGIYGPGTSFHQWELGDFSATDSPIGDFIGGFPVDFPDDGQVNAYEVSITGYSMVHFDTFNHIESPTHAIFGPFSHDGEVAVPEPASLLLIGLGVSGVGVFGLFRRR